MKLHVGNGPEIELDAGSALDIGSLRLDGIELSPGNAVPDDGDPRILHSVGGFLFTCGPDHIRHPEPIAEGKGRYPLHGSMAGHLATIVNELHAGDCDEISARIRIRLADGGEAEVTRQWRMNAPTGEVMLVDRLVNTGGTAFAPMWMYHMNIGAHLFDDNTRLAGSMFEADGMGWTFGEGDGHVFCVPAAAEAGDEYARVVLGPIAAIGGRSLHVRFATDTLPHLQMWRNQVAPAYVLGIEPVSHPWKNRSELEAMGLMDRLEPGDFRTYRLAFAFR